MHQYMETNRQTISMPVASAVRDLHPAWREFIRYCRDLGHGHIERLSIQDGVPVMAEVTVKKVKFKRDV
jgi:hypothetical protein